MIRAIFEFIRPPKCPFFDMSPILLLLLLTFKREIDEVNTKPNKKSEEKVYLILGIRDLLHVRFRIPCFLVLVGTK